MLYRQTPSSLERYRALRDPDTAGDYLAAAFHAGPEAYVIAKDEILRARRLVLIRVRATFH